MNFWTELKNNSLSSGKPILCLAPMADVTDRAFRQIIAKYSKPGFEAIDTHDSSVKTSSSLSTDKSLLAFSSARLSQPAQGTLGRVFATTSQPYVTWTEFVSADGLFKGGYDSLINDLAFTESERPIVAQFFTSSPEMMERAAELALNLGFDGVDINMGCPDKSVEKQGAGAALIKNPALAKEIILAAKRGAKSDDGGIPVSVKTRLGYNKDELETWLPELLSVSPAVITIHARTRKEMSLVPARWERIRRAVEIRDSVQNFLLQHPQKSTDIFLLKNSSCSAQSASQASFENVAPENFESGSLASFQAAAKKNLHEPASRASFELVAEENRGTSTSQGNSELMTPKNLQEKTLIFGNGDVLDVEDAHKKAEETGADGVMIGRGIFGNPWVFTGYKASTEEKLRVFLEQAKLFEKIVGPKWPDGQGKSFAVMKKHLKAYCEGFPGCKELRTKMMEAENTEQMEQLVNQFLLSYN